MNDARVTQKAQVALAFRAEPKRIFLHYIRIRWKRQLFVTLIFATLIAGAWIAGQPLVAVGILGFWAGRIMRDYQWFWFLTGEWGTTCALIDWPKAELLAAGIDNPGPDYSR